nr:type II toxin-antitoxin system MqsR family toxin [Bacteroidales bacterium]
MTSKQEVQKFLYQFHEKCQVYDIVFRDDRGKNLQTLAELGITANYRLTVIKSIKVEDYSEGPIVDALNKYGDMWVFGKDIKGNEVYIKISLGQPNNRTLCISFHKAEYKMQYPFKNQ